MHQIYSWIVASFGPEVDWKQVFLVGMSPIFVLTFMIEFVVEKKRGRGSQFQWKEVVANVSLGAAYQVAEAVMWIIFTGAIFLWVYSHRLFDIPVNGWTVIPIFVLVEFCLALATLPLG